MLGLLKVHSGLPRWGTVFIRRVEQSLVHLNLDTFPVFPVLKRLTKRCLLFSPSIQSSYHP